MTLQKLIELVNEHYPDNMIIQTWNKGVPVHCGDGLALFICYEVRDTFSSKDTTLEQKAGVCRVLQTAVDDLESVIDGVIG